MENSLSFSMLQLSQEKEAQDFITSLLDPEDQTPVKSQRNGQKTYKFSKDEEALGHLIISIARGKAKHGIRHWGVSQASLEDAYVSVPCIFCGCEIYEVRGGRQLRLTLFEASVPEEEEELYPSEMCSVQCEKGEVSVEATEPTPERVKQAGSSEVQQCLRDPNAPTSSQDLADKAGVPVAGPSRQDACETGEGFEAMRSNLAAHPFQNPWHQSSFTHMKVLADEAASIRSPSFGAALVLTSPLLRWLLRTPQKAPIQQAPPPGQSSPTVRRRISRGSSQNQARMDRGSERNLPVLLSKKSSLSDSSPGGSLKLKQLSSKHFEPVKDLISMLNTTDGRVASVSPPRGVHVREESPVASIAGIASLGGQPIPPVPMPRRSPSPNGLSAVTAEPVVRTAGYPDRAAVTPTLAPKPLTSVLAATPGAPGRLGKPFQRLVVHASTGQLPGQAGSDHLQDGSQLCDEVSELRTVVALQLAAQHMPQAAELDADPSIPFDLPKVRPHFMGSEHIAEPRFLIRELHMVDWHDAPGSVKREDVFLLPPRWALQNLRQLAVGQALGRRDERSAGRQGNQTLLWIQRATAMP
eukprot:Skav202287  [mRNA]  locus=scaffold3364:19412:45465:+ [translate_table: standard]